MTALTGGFSDLQIRMYHDLLEHEMQQKGSVLGGTVTVTGAENGESEWFPKIGKLSSYEVTGRNQAVDLEDLTAERRGLTKQIIESAQQIEAIDLPRYARSPQPELVEAMARQLGRQKDVIIINALSGTALREINGSSSNASFDSNNTIAVNTNTFGMANGAGLLLTGDTGLHEGKIQNALNKLQAAYAMEPGDEVFVIAPSIQLTGLKSRAFAGNNAALFQKNLPDVHMPMADRALDGFLGCRFVQYENTGVDGSSDQYVYIYLRKAVKFTVYQDVSFRADDQPQKKGTPVLVKGNMTVGAVRMWEEAVVRVLCDPTPTYAVA